MIDKSDINYQKFINGFVKFFKTNGQRSKKVIFALVNEQLQEEYKNKAEQWRIDWLVEDVTNSICMKMGVR